MSLTSLLARIDDLVRDKDGVVFAASKEQALADALTRYSADRPRLVVVDVVSAGGVELPMPAGWREDSRLLLVEAPADQVPAVELNPAEVRQRARPSGMVLVLPASQSSGTVVRLGYTAPHVVDATTDTLPAEHAYAVACLAAANICGQLASFYASEGMPTLGADSADHQGKTDRYRARARDLMAQYTSVLGVPERKTVAAGVVTNMRGTDSEGRQRLFHARRYR